MANPLGAVTLLAAPYINTHLILKFVEAAPNSYVSSGKLILN